MPLKLHLYKKFTPHILNRIGWDGNILDALSQLQLQIGLSILPNKFHI